MGSDSEADLIRLYKQRLADRKKMRPRRNKRRLGQPEEVGGLLRDLFRNDPQAMRKMEESRAILAWQDIVGDTVAKASQALKIRGVTLVVRVSDPMWMQNLALFKNDILQKYKKQFPRLKITDIFFVA